MSDDYEGNFDNRRAMITTMNFTAKTYMFGHIADTAEGLIKKVNVDYYTDTDRVRSREKFVMPTPRVKDYDDDNTAKLSRGPLVQNKHY